MQLPCGHLVRMNHARAGMAESARAPPFSFAQVQASVAVGSAHLVRATLKLAGHSYLSFATSSCPFSRRNSSTVLVRAYGLYCAHGAR
jgi:hypothetical protein